MLFLDEYAIEFIELLSSLQSELSKETISMDNKEIKELSSKMDKMIEGFSDFKEDVNQKLNSVHFKLSYKLTIMVFMCYFLIFF